MYFKAHAGHIGCALSCIDLMIVLLFRIKSREDKFILSKGHAAAALYKCLHKLGEISDDAINSFYKDGTQLPAHAAPGMFSGIPFATGSLGHGLPVGTGMAKARKLKSDPSRVYVLMSDGETNAGTCWEAAHFAVVHQLDNLIVIIDKNGLQGFDRLENVLGDTAAIDKWKGIGFEVLEIDGHNEDEIEKALHKLNSSALKSPKLVIANTLKGKGVSYMENRLEWHYLPMSEDLYNMAIQEIKEKYRA